MGERRTGGRALGLSAVAAAAGVLLATAGPALADPLAVRVGRIGEVVAQPAGPSTPPGPGNVVGSTPVHTPSFVHLGADVVGAYCRQFGLEFQAANLAPGEEALVSVQLQHPLWTLPDGRTSTVETNASHVASDRWTYAGYTLEEPWSLAQGRWTFTVLEGTRVLATASFELTVEPGQQAPQAGCLALTS